MKNRVRQLLSVVLTACMLVTMVPLTAYGADVDFQDDVSASVEAVEETQPDLTADTDVEIDEEEPDSTEDVSVETDDEENEEAADNLEVQSEDVFSSDEQTEEFTSEAVLNVDDCYQLTGASAPTLKDTFLKIVFVDCGRKYFSVESLKQIIDNAASSGFKYVELGVGNDGLRFLLDDMKLQVNGTEYSSEAVKNAIHAGNEGYYNFDTDELTESDMDTIIDYASQKNIGIIPLVNTPGHMDAILSAANSLTGSTCSYNGSARTIDVSNATAVAFTQALMQKYIDYFASKGCKLFNMGADEYANDIYTKGSMGFGNLQSEKKYGYFVKYVNKMADMIKAAGMTPMAFNDGIYFNNDKSDGTIDNSIVVCYWSDGWSGYTPRSAADLIKSDDDGDGFRLVNTHGDYYWVLGKSDWQCSADKAAGFNYKKFQGGTIENPSGAMFCIWCDYPGADTDSNVVENTKNTIVAFGKTLPKTESESGSVKINESYNTNENKFTVDSSVTLTLSNNDKIVAFESKDPTVVSLKGIPAEKNEEENLASDETKEYSAVVGTALKPGSSTITLTDTKGGSYKTELTVAADRNNPVEKNITVTVNSDYTETLEGNLTAEELKYDNSVVNVKTELQKENAENISYNASTSTNVKIYENYTLDNLIDGNNSTYFWEDGNQSVGQYVQVDLGTAIPFNTVQLTSPSDVGNDYCEDADVLVSADGSNWENIGSYTGTTSPQNFSNNKLPKVRYIRVQITKDKKNWWKLAEIAWGNTSGGQFTRMDSQGTVTTEAKDQTLVTFTGLKEGKTSVQIGTVKYNIKVDNENINTVEPITVEYWITNRPVTANGAESGTIKATDSSVHSEKGAKISEFVPATGTQGGNEVVFLKGTRLTSDKRQTDKQGVDRFNSGDDFTYVRYWNQKWSFSSDGETWTDFNSSDQVVAYYLQKTQVTDEVTTEVKDWGVNRASYDNSNYVLLDYAVKYQTGDRNPASFPTDKTIAFHCDPGDSTSVHQYNNGDSRYWYNNYREIGMIRAENTDDYEVYMITLTPTSNNNRESIGDAASTAYSYTYNYDANEKVLWVDNEAHLGDFADESKHFKSISGKYNYHVGGDATIEGLEIFNQHGMLVTYYLKAKETQDSLRVHYMNETSNEQFYGYSITVEGTTQFDEKIGLNKEKWKGPLDNGTVVNSLGKNQTVSADLGTMPEIGSTYRYSDYTCKKVTRSAGGKDVYLYYTFNNVHNFVVDYGLKLTIKASDLGLSDTSWKSAYVAKQPTCGKATTDSDYHTLTYVPEEVIKGIDEIFLTIEDNNGAKITHTISIYPATSVYYEETFIENGTGSKDSNYVQTASKEGSKANYGYDRAYKNDAGASGGTQTPLTSEVSSFSFQGSGVDIYANTDTQEAVMSVAAYKGETLKKFKLVVVDTQMKNEGTATGQEVKGYNVPVVSMDFQEWNKYKLELKQVKGGTVYLDGFRVYNTLESSKDEAKADEVYAKDNEVSPKYYEVRDQVLNALGVQGSKSEKYADQIAKNAYSQVHATGGVASAVILDPKVDPNNTTAQDMLDNGPKNEVYLQPDQQLVFKLGSGVSAAQIGMSGLNGSTTAEVSWQDDAIKLSTVEMYYVLDTGKSEDNTFTITNRGSKVLSITKLKVFGNVSSQEAAFASLTEDDLTTALVGLGYEKAPAPTATPTPTQKPVQQIKLDTPKLDKVAAVGHNALKVSWSKVKNADGYRVYVKENGKWKTVGDTKSTSYVHKNLKTGKSYTYTVKAYKKTAGGTVWSSYNKKGITGKTVLKAPKLRRVKRNSAKKATLTWNKVDGANGYVVYRKTNNGSWKAVKRITKGNVTSFRDTKLSKGKKYTYTVRAYCTVDKKNVYSGYDKKGLTVK